MAPKKPAAAAAAPAAAPAAAATTVPAPKPAKPHSSTTTSNPVSIVSAGWASYAGSTPQRTKLMDVFMCYLVVTGVLQFAYCVIAGNYPFNAFLAGFGATVGQFVLTASLRMQTNAANKGEFSEVSPERAFADFVFGSLILHVFCTNFIN